MVVPLLQSKDRSTHARSLSEYIRRTNDSGRPMTKCCMTGKTFKCEKCNSTQTHFFYGVDHTKIMCQRCNHSFYTYNHRHKKYGQQIVYGGEKS